MMISPGTHLFSPQSGHFAFSFPSQFWKRLVCSWFMRVPAVERIPLRGAIIATRARPRNPRQALAEDQGPRIARATGSGLAIGSRPPGGALDEHATISFEPQLRAGRGVSPGRKSKRINPQPRRQIMSNSILNKLGLLAL